MIRRRNKNKDQNHDLLVFILNFFRGPLDPFVFFVEIFVFVKTRFSFSEKVFFEKRGFLMKTVFFGKLFGEHIFLVKFVLVKTGFWWKPVFGENMFLVKTCFFIENPFFGWNMFLGEIFLGLKRDFKGQHEWANRRTSDQAGANEIIFGPIGANGRA